MHLYPSNSGSQDQSKLFYFDVDVSAGHVSGYALNADANQGIRSDLLWRINFPKDTEKLVKCEGYANGEVGWVSVMLFCWAIVRLRAPSSASLTNQ